MSPSTNAHLSLCLILSAESGSVSFWNFRHRARTSLVVVLCLCLCSQANGQALWEWVNGCVVANEVMAYPAKGTPVSVCDSRCFRLGACWSCFHPALCCVLCAAILLPSKRARLSRPGVRWLEHVRKALYCRFESLFLVFVCVSFFLSCFAVVLAQLLFVWWRHCIWRLPNFRRSVELRSSRRAVDVGLRIKRFWTGRQLQQSKLLCKLPVLGIIECFHSTSRLRFVLFMPSLMLCDVEPDQCSARALQCRPGHGPHQQQVSLQFFFAVECSSLCNCACASALFMSRLFAVCGCSAA